jgi:hypothetical protein
MRIVKRSVTRPTLSMSCEACLDEPSARSATGLHRLRLLHALVEPKPLRGRRSRRAWPAAAAAHLGHSFLQVALRDKEEDMQPTEFEQLLTETLAARGRSPRTQETYTLMLRLSAGT